MRFRRSWCRTGTMLVMVVFAAACVSEPGSEGASAGGSAAGGAGGGASGPGGSGAGGTAEIQAAPTFGSPDTAQRATVLEYARAARFVSDLRLIDEQTLAQARGGRGPRARVEATVYAHQLSRAQLARGALIGRVVSDGPYTALGLRRGVQYFFVDSAGTAGWRSIIVFDDTTLAPRVTRLFLTDTLHHRPPGTLVPGSRWIEHMGWIYPNIPCGKMCCVPCEPPLLICPTMGWPPRLDPLTLEVTTTTLVP